MSAPVALDRLQRLSESLYEHLRTVARNRPGWLKVSPRRADFECAAFRRTAVACFCRQFPAGADRGQLLAQSLEILAFFLVPRYFASVEHLCFAPTLTAVLADAPAPPGDGEGGAVVLLDAACFRLDGGDLDRLGIACGYPILARLAWADWRTITPEGEARLVALGFGLRQGEPGESELAALAIDPWLQEAIVCSPRPEFAPLDPERFTVYRVSDLEGTLVVRNARSGTYRFFARSLC